MSAVYGDNPSRYVCIQCCCTIVIFSLTIAPTGTPPRRIRTIHGSRPIPWDVLQGRERNANGSQMLREPAQQRRALHVDVEPRVDDQRVFLHKSE